MELPSCNFLKPLGTFKLYSFKAFFFLKKMLRIILQSGKVEGVVVSHQQQ